MGTLVIVLYVAAMCFILLYSMVQAHLALRYLIHRRRERRSPSTPEQLPGDLPKVTVQLPIFNERYVIERLLDAVGEFDYPADKLQIQVLDDSTDDTVQIVAEKVKALRAKGLDITHLHRTHRAGYKAGALDEGLRVATGEFVAIFDADFIPSPDFLRRTLPWFGNPSIGMVQTRWEHLNERYNLLTRMQAFGLDAHFTVEQQGRNAGGYFMNFNGTAGVWRRKAIAQAGGWQPDTLTEDLDLSYRAQLVGWQFKYLEAVGSPAELPAAMPGVKSQQFRWTKGAAEVARKNLGLVMRSKLPAGVKLHALFHLLNSSIFICILLQAFLILPMVWLKSSETASPFFRYASLLTMPLLFVALFFFVSRLRGDGPSMKRRIAFIWEFPLFLMVSSGLSLHNAIATIEGYLGIRSPFIRTPKFNLRNLQDSWKNKEYAKSRISLVTLIEGAMALYFGTTIGLSIYWGEYGMLPFAAMLFLGYSLIFVYSLRHSRAS
jgi:cellulose synthase/poly-beta-1,6-N-acetylglucosamine synthase-like glycosyltransferase